MKELLKNLESHFVGKHLFKFPFILESKKKGERVFIAIPTAYWFEEGWLRQKDFITRIKRAGYKIKESTLEKHVKNGIFPEPIENQGEKLYSVQWIELYKEISELEEEEADLEKIKKVLISKEFLMRIKIRGKGIEAFFCIEWGAIFENVNGELIASRIISQIIRGVGDREESLLDFEILAIDPGGDEWGFAIFNRKGALLESGFRKVKNKKHYARRVKSIQNDLEGVFHGYNIKIVVIEDQHSGINKKGALILSRFGGVFLSESVKAGVEWVEFIKPTEWKSLVFGDGGAKQSDVRTLIEAELEENINENQAASIAIGKGFFVKIGIEDIRI